MKRRARRVRFHADFNEDLAAQLSWLVERGDVDGIHRLRVAVAEAVQLAATFRHAGARTENDRVRKLILRRLPFVIWYADGPLKSDLWFLRFFHARQARQL